MTNFYSANGINFTNPRDKTAINVTYNGLLAKSGANTIYAVPIECISLERGGTNPFGEWYQANNSYWAYVLVQYDDTTSSYTYGFTFKDSAGYGLYPITIEKLSTSGKEIQTGLSLAKPKNGNITNITEKDNWTGFSVQDDTKLVVLEAASEGETGDGKKTCTLCQKGKNYDKVEEEKMANSTNDDDDDGVLDNCVVGKKIPIGGVYTMADGTILKEGDTFPITPATGDQFVYGDFIYKYNNRYIFFS